MSRPRLLDLFCGAGGAAMGYYRAGFDVVGVDINPQPHYPFEFVQGDALHFLRVLFMTDTPLGRTHAAGHRLRDFEAIHASPPCQAYSRAKSVHRKQGHPQLIGPTRELLRRFDGPTVIENVELAPLDAQLMLCGSMFGLRIRRHRYFEFNRRLDIAPMDCLCRGLASKGFLFNPYNTIQRRRFMERFGYTSPTKAMQDVMEVPWIPSGGGASRGRGLSGDVSNAIPPAYTEWIGTQLMAALRPQEVSQ